MAAKHFLTRIMGDAFWKKVVGGKLLLFDYQIDIPQQVFLV